MEPWNDRKLLPPPINTFHCTQNVDKNELKYICEDILRILKKQSPLHQEGAIMSRFVYKFDKKFRNDMGYHKFKKVNTCLRRYLELNLVGDIEQFNSVICPEEDYLPTRQMLEYVLVRIISFAMLKVRIYVTAKQSAVFYLARLQRGESYWMSLLPYAVLSRIWSISSVLLQQACKWYHKLYPYLNILQLKGLPFLKDYVLPENLAKYINLNEIDDMGRFNWSVNKITKVVSILNDDEENNDGFDLLKYVEDINKDCEQIQRDVSMEIPKEESLVAETINLFNNGDIGVPISRENLIPKFTQECRELNHVKKQDIPETTTIFKNTDIGVPISRDSLMSMFTSESNEKLNDVKKPEMLATATLFKNTDIQELISRDTLIPNKRLKKKKSEESISHNIIDNKKSHEINSITNSKLLKIFIKKEEKYRNKDDKRSLTEHLSFMQWQALKQNLTNLLELHDKKMSKRLKRIWKEKCLDYL